MESIPENDYLQYHNNTMHEVRKLHNLDQPGKMLEAIEILEDWLKKQDHFVKKDFSRYRLELTIIGAKGSIEKAKSRLDQLCTYRTVLPKYFDDFDIRTDFKDVDSVSYRAPLPKLTNDHIRVSVVKAAGSKIGSNFTVEAVRLAIMYAEYFYIHDYSDGYAFIVDFTELDLIELASNLNLIEVRDGVGILIEALGVRLKAIHIISHSKLLEALMTFVKPVLSKKVNKRIYLHKSIETVYEFVPRKILPMEYGGNEKSYKILHEEFTNQMSSEKFRNHQKEMLNAIIDESKRPKDDFNNYYMGMPGTFRKLCVD